MKTRLLGFLHRYSVALGWVYFTVLFGWLALYLLTGDSLGYLGLLNNLAVYLFFPLPLIALIAIFVGNSPLRVTNFRQGEFWIKGCSPEFLKQIGDDNPFADRCV